jgi:UDP-N-acetylmuramoylalanine--D-glutamate ligase
VVMDANGVLERLRMPEAPVVVVGMGISGVETARFLKKRGLVPICIERYTEAEFRERSRFVEQVDALMSEGIPVYFGIDGEAVGAVTEGAVAAVLSPGVPLGSAVVGALERRGLPLIGEFELGLCLATSPAIVVTGSNGKSTTVSLLDFVCQEAGIPARLCGNVGTPVVAEVSSTGDAPLLIVEASSYQLEGCSLLQPRVGVFLNLSDNHLERHGTMERYRAAKARLFKNQDPTDFAILNYDDQWVRQIEPFLNGSIRWFGLNLPEGVPGVRILWNPPGEDLLVLNSPESTGTVSLTNSSLLGLHNRYNIAAALAAFVCAGGTVEQFQAAIGNFQGLPHRIQQVSTTGGALWINDSKSTTVAATCAALDSVLYQYPDQPITLMIGGLLKAGSWKPLFDRIRRARENGHSPAVLCFGRDAGLLVDMCKEADVTCSTSPTVAEAIASLVSREVRGVVLFSPGGASFDEFKNFEERGETFSALVARHYG